jgi:hypothetical protein
MDAIKPWARNGEAGVIRFWNTKKKHIDQSPW